MRSVARSGEFVRFVLDLMAPLGEIRARAMFGGHGIYQADAMFAIVADDRLYLKADSATSGAFAERNLSQFTYVARGKTITMQYYEAPPEVFESPLAMQIWAQQSIAAALRARSDKPKD